MVSPSRAAFLGAGSAIALVGASRASEFVALAARAHPEDIQSLNGAIELERAGVKAYQDAAATGLLSPAVVAIARGFVSDHLAHRDALIGAVLAAGGTPSTAIARLVYPKLENEKDILYFAKDVEEKAASTYLSVVSDFRDRKLAEIAASILGVETTHVSVLASALGISRAYPSAFVA